MSATLDVEKLFCGRCFSPRRARLVNGYVELAHTLGCEFMGRGVPLGLCASHEPHDQHLVSEGSLAPFYCDGDQTRRLPFAAERRRTERKNRES